MPLITKSLKHLHKIILRSKFSSLRGSLIYKILLNRIVLKTQRESLTDQLIEIIWSKIKVSCYFKNMQILTIKLILDMILRMPIIIHRIIRT